jgi:mono/diheme cytochrome c family protein
VENDPAELVAGVAYSPDDIAPGGALYVSNCLFCHGVPGVNNGGNIPNLGFSDAAMLEGAPDLLLSGAFVVSAKAIPSGGGQPRPILAPEFVMGCHVLCLRLCLRIEVSI